MFDHLNQLKKTDQLNQLDQFGNCHCHCQKMDVNALWMNLEKLDEFRDLPASLKTSHPHLFSPMSLVIDQKFFASLQDSIAAIERTIAHPRYAELIESRYSPGSIAAAGVLADFGPAGVCMGYDFHMGESGTKLIEINTNAGGLLLNELLARTFRDLWSDQNLVETIAEMFETEWQLQLQSQHKIGKENGKKLKTIAIVDENPTGQYLAPEFILFQKLFEKRGLQAMIVDPRELAWDSSHQVLRQRASGIIIDLVYNRLTDFYLEGETQQDLRSAYMAQAIVLTPHPRTHAFFADKRNLVTLSDQELLAAWGVNAEDRQLLEKTVPQTRIVAAADAASLWANRKKLFFKPFTGYASKAAYRGDKITKRVWEEILQGEFVAQDLVAPSVCEVEVRAPANLNVSEKIALKFDMRAYTYRGNIQLLAARLYSGQTTNFRTPGGGFAPIFVCPSSASAVS